MKAFDVRKLASEQGGEYVLGMKDLHTHACYLVYGILGPGEEKRLVRPGQGHEEILCAVDGDLSIHTRTSDETLEQGNAVHVKEDESFSISNPWDKPVVYVLAGGHSGSHH